MIAEHLIRYSKFEVPVELSSWHQSDVTSIEPNCLAKFLLFVVVLSIQLKISIINFCNHQNVGKKYGSH